MTDLITMGGDTGANKHRRDNETHQGGARWEPQHEVENGNKTIITGIKQEI